MALIKCKECGHDVSDKASKCPNCGCPIQTEGNPSVNETNVESQHEKKGNGKKWALLAVLLCIICGGGYYAYTKLFKGGSDKESIVELTPEFINAIQKYDKLGSFSEGYAAVLKEGKWGYINIKGEEVISCQYSNPYEEYTSGAFHEGLAAVQKDGKWGYINTKGEEVIPITLDVQYANCFSDGLAVIINDYNNFSVIDTKGNIVFKGKCNIEQFGEEMVYEMQQNYVQGKLYMPVESNKYAVYDKQGKKLGEESEEQKEDFIKQNSKVLYKIYSDEREENISLGLKDVDGKVIVPATYDRIGDKVGGNVDFSNGVLVVMIEEIGEDVMEGQAGEIYSPDTKYHYGYVDLKGKDTFSDELKQKCKKSREQAMQKIKQQEEEMFTDSDNNDWLQGRWIGTTASGNSVEVIIEGGNFTEKIDGHITYSGSYDFNGDMLIYDNANAFWPVDKDNKVLTHDGRPMRKESAGASTNPSSSYNDNAGNSNQNEEMRIMSRLHELGEKGQSLVSELSAMRQRGQMDPARYLHIKQTLIQYKVEQIRLSRELGDEQMTREYMQQKDEVLQSFRMIENGY
ncbi:MAG: WG repeat-containing protein [Prevotella sp.]|nr:WG repeat-containing protein [Prevotella sp.]